MTTALVHGLAVAGRSTAAALVGRGWEVVTVDDLVDDERRSAADELGVELVQADRAHQIIDRFDVYSPSPGVRTTHPLFAAAAASGVEICGELELAYRFEAERPGGPRPMLGVTGTDGKTSTTLMVETILNASGRRSVAAGNTDVPLIEAIDLDVDAFVVECSSFRLATTTQFRCDAGAWLNFAADHLDWHSGLAEYESVKARIYSQQRHDDVSVGVIDDPTVARHLDASPARRVTVGLDSGEYRVADGELVGPTGTLIAVRDLVRSLPHDRTNALVAAALCLESGICDRGAVADGLAGFTGPAHRIEFVAEAGGVGWYNDSKATTPHATLAALRGFESVVLVAGGRNKGLELEVLRSEVGRIRAVVAIGEAAGVIETVFGGSVPVIAADTMSTAVRSAAGAARHGDVVLLSPACASFDWYPGGYQARGDDFKAEVRRLRGVTEPGAVSHRANDQIDDQIDDHDQEDTDELSDT